MRIFPLSVKFSVINLLIDFSFMFADDTSMLIHGKDVSLLSRRRNE